MALAGPLLLAQMTDFVLVRLATHPRRGGQGRQSWQEGGDPRIFEELGTKGAHARVTGILPGLEGGQDACLGRAHGELSPNSLVV